MAKSNPSDPLVHGYFQIDLDVVWAVMEKDLPPLFESIQTILPAE
jgi:uncharacterized protein with HEPN domain